MDGTTALSNAFNSAIPLITVLFVVSLSLLGYLKTGNKKVKSYRYEVIENLEGRFDKIQSQVEKSIETKAGLSNEEKNELIKQLKALLTTETASGVLEEIRQQYTQLAAKQDLLNSAERRFTESSGRLSEEVEALGKRANLNLVLGIMTAGSGLAVIAYVVFMGNPQPDLQDNAFITLVYYIPRISLVLFVEVFAYFFLQLYKSSLGEIKYFQNELTNLEVKYSALRVALGSDDKDLRSAVVTKLSLTERNFVLKKGESTVELEVKKADKDHLIELTTAIAEAISKAKKS